MTSFSKAHDFQAPRARRSTRHSKLHGIDIADDFFWIRAENWREAIQDPDRLPQDIRNLLEAENGYADSVLSDLAPLAEAIHEELSARIDETDCDPPARDGDFDYFRRYREEGEHELVCRRRIGGDGKEAPEQILLDGDLEAEDLPYFSLGAAQHSPDHRHLAWSGDSHGNELYVIRCRDLDTGGDGADEVANTDGEIVWMQDSRAFLYTRVDEDFRTAQVFLHEVGASPSTDRLVFEEKDPAWFVHLSSARSRSHAVITVSDHDCSECWLVDLSDATAPARRILPRRAGLRYDVEPGLGRLFMRTNDDGAFDYKLLSAPLDAFKPGAPDPDACGWREEAPHRPGRMIFNATVFADYLVWLEREDCRPRLVVRALDGQENGQENGQEHNLAFDTPCHHLRLEPNFDFERPILRLSYSSLTEPEEIYDINLATRARVLLKRQIVPSGHDPAAYQSRLTFATAPDGEKVPMSLVWRKDSPPGPRPVLLYGYGAYGVALPDDFDEQRFSLIDRGFVYAIAHVRGGSEKGSRWYEAGKFERKTNTFIDFIACARHLCAEGVTEPGKIVAEGGSAGGMLIGAVANLAPELFGGMIAERALRRRDQHDLRRHPAADPAGMARMGQSDRGRRGFQGHARLFAL